MGVTITIPAIDEDGGLYPIEKLAAHAGGGVLHLAISIFVFWEDRLLIQKRAAGKYHCSGLWANTCCTHPGWGEEMLTAAHRRLREELGFDVPDLQRRAVIDYHAQVSDDLWERERVHVFEHVCEGAAPVPKPDRSEVSETRWVKLAELRQEVELTPEKFAPWFRIYLNRWEDLALTGAPDQGPAASVMRERIRV
jgi:isopentenyl-diphosphate delta-isomerase